MRKQLYYALAAVVLASVAAPEEGYAAPVTKAPVPTTLTATTSHGAGGVMKRKRGKKRRGSHRRRR